MACVSDDESQLFSFDPYKPPKPSEPSNEG